MIKNDKFCNELLELSRIHQMPLVRRAANELARLYAFEAAFAEIASRGHRFRIRFGADGCVKVQDSQTHIEYPTILEAAEAIKDTK